MALTASTDRMVAAVRGDIEAAAAAGLGGDVVFRFGFGGDIDFRLGGDGRSNFGIGGDDDRRFVAAVVASFGGDFDRRLAAAAYAACMPSTVRFGDIGCRTVIFVRAPAVRFGRFFDVICILT